VEFIVYRLNDIQLVTKKFLSKYQNVYTLEAMKEKPAFRILFLLFVLAILSLLECPYPVCAQQAITTGGGTFTDNGGSLSVSIGQVAYTNHAGDAGTMSQGVQQPYEISSLGIETDDHAYSLSFQAFPNPSDGLLTLKGEVPQGKKVIWRLTDSHGKTLDSRRISSDETLLDLSKRTAGIYFLQLVQGNRMIRSFKIIKN